MPELLFHLDNWAGALVLWVLALALLGYALRGQIMLAAFWLFFHFLKLVYFIKTRRTLR